jgi:hypothetical protein
MPKEIDPDLKKAYEALIEEQKKLADPRRIYTRSDQLYPDPRFRPDYVDPSYEKPVYKGMLPGGAEESDISPLDFITEVPSLAKGALKGFPALMGVIKKKAGSELPEEMSLLERIKLAAKRSGVKAPEMEVAQAEREALRNKPKDFFDKAREKSSKEIFEENEKKLAKKAAADKAFKEEFEPGWYHGTNEEKTNGKIIEEFYPDSFFTKDTNFASNYSGYLRGEKGSQVIPISLNTKNFFNPENASHLKTLEDSLTKHYETNPEMRLFEKMLYPEYADYHTDPVKRAKFIIDALKQKIKSNESTWAVLEDKNIEQALKNAGYEGALLKEMGSPTAISYAPKNIRSPWAKFDPAMKDSADYLAGLAAAGLSFDQIKELLNKKQTDKGEL